MARAIWKGSISFGLVTIPVSLYSAVESGAGLSFHQLDGRDLKPVRQKRVNEETGEEVPWEDVVKGYEYEEDRYVVLTPDEIEAVNVEKTQTIDIHQVVDHDEIDHVYFEKPYYLGPAKQGRKAYALLREVLKRQNGIAIATLVLRQRESLCALVPRDRVLSLDVMRWPYEIRPAEGLDLPEEALAEEGVSDTEMRMAEQLVSAMKAPWDPSRYRDTFRDEVLAMIQRKAETGRGPELVPVGAPERPAKAVDMMDLLKRSLEQQQAAGDGGKRAAGDGRRKAAPEREKAPAGDRGRR